MNILHVDSGIFVEQSVSRKLSADVVAQLKANNESAQVTHVDLIQNPVGHTVPQAVLDCFDARSPAIELGAEYQPAEMISWVESNR